MNLDSFLAIAIVMVAFIFGWYGRRMIRFLEVSIAELESLIDALRPLKHIDTTEPKSSIHDPDDIIEQTKREMEERQRKLNP